jgi:predicted small lipoprotein YifL
MFNLPMNRTKSALLLCVFLLFVAACGQHGPLYLPEPAPEPSPTEENEEKNEETPGT